VVSAAQEEWAAPVVPVEWAVSVVPVDWGAPVVSVELVVPAASVARVVRRNYLLAATPGNIILRIAAEHPTETAQRPIDSAVQLVATLSPTVRAAQETRSVAREEISPAIAAEPAPATA
jgi:hypothetical protein